MRRALNSKIKTWDRSLWAIGGPQKSLSRGITGNEPGRLEGGERNGGRAYSGGIFRFSGRVNPEPSEGLSWRSRVTGCPLGLQRAPGACPKGCGD